MLSTILKPMTFLYSEYFLKKIFEAHSIGTAVVGAIILLEE